MGGSVSVHDTAITQRSIVLLDLPVTFDVEAASAGASFPYRWEDGYHSRVGLLPRDGESTDVVWHDIEPCYVFHPMNAFDDPGGDGIVLDVVRHPSMFRTKFLGPDEGTPTLERWHLDGHGGAVKEERLDDRGQEFPRVDERRVGRPHRYGYAVAVGESDDILGTESVLLRHDLEQGTSVARSFGRGTSVGEAVFVPRADGADETDGWLLLLVHSAETGGSALHILNAEDVEGEAQAVIDLPRACPPASTGIGCPTRPDQGAVTRPAPTRSAVRSDDPRGTYFDVFVWQWVQQHRMLSVIVLALVIVSCAGGTAWALVFRTVSSPVGLREALRIYRREQTGKVLSSLRNRLPVPGVYLYDTTGARASIWSAWPAPSLRAPP